MRHTAHHQEPKTALAASGLAYVEGCWTCSCWTLSGNNKLSNTVTSCWSFHKNGGCYMNQVFLLNPLNPELNPICYLLALLGAHHFLHVSRIRVKLLTLRRVMSYIYIYIYMEHPFLMFLDHTQRRSTVGRTPLDE